ncbi:MAG: alpha,alpha-trehalose-phosphate synthase (UDP-forming) [Alphaproteobacteria bacterium]|nr:alpha,alpha-trehalose-phosphate synthase (UDP-forming) [Alphaproteobacteria bacterium]
MSRLVIVSNRVTKTQGGGAQVGGLAVGLLGALEELGGLWFGWSGQVTENPSDAPRFSSSDGVSYATLDLSERDYEEYYNGFSNETLWPLFHYRLDLVDFHRKYYQGYRRANTRFAKALAGLVQPDDLIWVHDYHLIPMAEELRRIGVRNRIGFFLHTPFPSHQVLVALPQHREIIAALSAYDVVGFQTSIDVRTFSHYIKFETRGVFDEDKHLIRAFRHTFHCDKFPIGIDAANVAAMAKAQENAVRVDRLIKSLRGRELLIGVDRLDYSKGLVHRFHAFELFLARHQDWHGKVVLLQIAPRTREDVQQYDDIRHELETEAGRINGAHAEFDWVPIRYLNRGFTRETLSAFYRQARVGVVTPLRDGMNLVAKEYIAAQNPSDPGVLVLSRFAGAAEQLSSALIVNPYDDERVAASLGRALEMPRKERRARWRAAYEVVCRHDIEAWRRSFLRVLGRAPFSM